MKKLIAVSVVFALIAGVAFADTYFGAWGRAVWVPLYYYGAEGGVLDAKGEEQHMLTGTEVGWANLPNMAFYYSISGEEIGAEVNWDFAANGRDGPLNTWWRPNEMFKIALGWARDDVLRGPDTIDSFAFLMGGMDDICDFTFHRSTTADWWAGNPGALFSITPMEGLFINIAINSGPGGEIPGWAGGGLAYTPLMDVLKASQYAFGYNIDGIGLVRAGYFGTSTIQGGDMPMLAQLAFRLTAVEGMFVDIGFGFCLDGDYKDANEGINPMEVGLVVGYTMDAFNLDLNVGAMLGGDKDKQGANGAPNIQAIVTPSYAMDFATIGGSILFKTALGIDDSSAFGGGVWLSKGVGGGSFKAGVAVEKPAGADSKVNFAIPVEITYSIW